MDKADELFKSFEKYRKGDEPKKMSQGEIVIRLNKSMVERMAYWLVIVGLILVIVFNPLSNLVSCDCEGENNIVGAAVIEDMDEPDLPDRNEQEADLPDSNEGEAMEDADEPVDSSDLAGDIKMVIGSVKTEEDEDGNPLKVTEIKFSIDNQKEDFRPMVKVFWYNVGDEMENVIRTSATYPTLSAGSAKDYTLSRFQSKYLSGAEKVYIKLYDADSENYLIKTSKSI